MKKLTLINLLLLTSTTIFSACSNKVTKLKIKTELLQQHNEQEQIAQLPMARTYPIRTIARTPIRYNNYMPPQREYYIQPQPHYIQAHYIQPNPRIQPRFHNNYRNNIYSLTNKIENDAKTLLGKKYVWGATGPYTYDCSGFTQKVYRDAGINIPRVSRDQAKVGEYVNYQNLRKGDMVFFDTHKKRTGSVSHVGIYLGNGNFIHASSGAKKVVIFNFNEKEFYKKRFLWGRRVIRDNTHMASL